MSIYTGKNDYDSDQEFYDRTKRAVEDERTFIKDSGPLDPNSSVVINTRETFKTQGLGGSILEVGCGYGRWSVALKGLYDHYTGVDIVVDRID